MNNAEELSPLLTNTVSTRKIDLAGEKALLGVDVPDSLDLPGDMPVFLDYQARWFEDESEVCIAEKSRRTGLTWAEAGRNVITAAKPKRRGGRNVFYVGSKQEMALEYISACALFSRAFNQLADADVYEQTFWDRDKKEEILTYMIRFPNSGFKIQALSSRPSNLRGLQGDVVIDEAAFHESLDELLKAAMALTMWGARVRIISTHNGVDNLFNQYIQEAREGRKDYSVHRITLDDAIADGLYRRICYVTGREWSPESEQKWRDDLYKNAPTREDADEEYGCIPKKSGGAYIPHALIEMAMLRDIPILTFEAPDDFISRAAWLRESEVLTWCEEHLKPLLEALNPRSRFSFGEDFARIGDLSCFVLLEITESLAKREVFRVELRNLPYAQQEQVMMYILTRVPALVGAAFDATGNGGYLAEAALDIPQIASRYIEHPASGITPNRAAQCLRGAERGDLIAQSDLAADIEEKDTHLFAELGKRRLAIQGVPWSIEPPPNASANEKKDAEMLDEYLHSADWFDAMLFDATDAILKGYSCMEIEHGMLGKMHIIRAIRWRDSGHFCLNPDDLSELRLRDGSHAGVAFQPFGWIVHQSRSRTGYGGATGLVRTLIWPFIFKNYSVRDLAEFLEVYGLPMKVGKYPSGATPEQKSALMRAVMDIGRRTGGIIPAGMSLEFQAAANGQADPFETMISWGERSISKAILGGTLTTEAGDKGARSLGEVHNEVRREIRDSDLRQLAATLNRDLVYPLYALNTAHAIDIRRLPRICFQTKEPGDITKITSAVMQLSTGMDIPDPWVREQTGIPQPAPGEAIFRVRQSGNEPAQTDKEMPPEKQEKTEQTALAARLPEAKSSPRDELDDMGDAVPARRLQEAIDPVLEPVIDAIRTRGLAEALADLPALYREMDDSRLMTLLSDAMFAAEMKGMLDGTGD